MASEYRYETRREFYLHVMEWADYKSINERIERPYFVLLLSTKPRPPRIAPRAARRTRAPMVSTS